MLLALRTITIDSSKYCFTAPYLCYFDTLFVQLTNDHVEYPIDQLANYAF